MGQVDRRLWDYSAEPVRVALEQRYGEQLVWRTVQVGLHSETATVPGFQPLEAYEVALQNLAPRLERRPPPEPLEFLAQRPGEIHAAAEVAAATGHRREHVEKRLAELAQSGQAVRIPASMGQLWSFGPPKFTPRCPPHPEVPADLQRGDLS